MATIQEIADWISEFVSDHCSKSGQALYLTKLGAEFLYPFGMNFRDACRDAGVQPHLTALVPFIQVYCQKLEIIPFEGLFDKAAVRPCDMPEAIHPAEMRPSTRPAPEGPRFFRAFWAAFIKPIPDGTRRLLTTSPAIFFNDVPDTQEPGPSQVEIEKRYIELAAQGELVSADLVLKKIEDWLSEKGLKAEQFYYKPKSSTPSQRPTALDGRSPGQASTPLKFFQLLPQEMKQRLSIPGDIVEFLLSVKE